MDGIRGVPASRGNIEMALSGRGFVRRAAICISAWCFWLARHLFILTCIRQLVRLQGAESLKMHRLGARQIDNLSSQTGLFSLQFPASTM